MTYSNSKATATHQYAFFCSLTPLSVQLVHCPSMPYVFCWPQIIPIWLVFRQPPIQEGKCLVLFFTSNILFSCFPFKSTSTFRICESSLSTRTMSPVALQRYQIIPSSLLFFLPFVYHCFLFWHNMWDVQTLKAAPRSFVWGTHHYPTPQPCMEWMLKNVRTMCIMYNNVLNIRSPLLHWDFCLYSPGLSGLIDLSWILH